MELGQRGHGRPQSQRTGSLVKIGLARHPGGEFPESSLPREPGVVCARQYRSRDRLAAATIKRVECPVQPGESLSILHLLRPTAEAKQATTSLNTPDLRSAIPAKRRHIIELGRPKFLGEPRHDMLLHQGPRMVFSVKVSDLSSLNSALRAILS